MKYKVWTLLITQLIFISGCARSEDAVDQKKELLNLTPYSSGHFKNNFEDAGQFWDLKHKGDKYHDQGKYGEAMEMYKEALDKHAHSRPEQTIALERIAITYEEIGDLGKAADNYDLASECTMNEGRKLSLKSKADGLRSKIVS